MKQIIICCLVYSLLWVACENIQDMPNDNPPAPANHLGTHQAGGSLISVQELPDAIQNYLETHYPTQNINYIFYNELAASHWRFHDHPSSGHGNHRPPFSQGGHAHGNHQGHASHGGNHNHHGYEDNDGNGNEEDGGEDDDNEDDNEDDEGDNEEDNDEGEDHDNTDESEDEDGYENGDSHDSPFGHHNNGGIYQVGLSDGTTLFFDEEGNLVYIEQPQGEWWEADHDHDEQAVLLSELPDTIINYVAANYPDRFIVKAEIEPDGNYEIRLNGGIKLYFDENGYIIQLEDEFSLRISSLSFPDSVTLGHTVTMTGYIVNESLYPFSGHTIRVNYAIEDEVPVSFLALTPVAQPFNSSLNIAPNDSIAFSFPIEVDAAFAIGLDIAVVWPDIPSSINPIFTGDPVASRTVWVFP